MRLSKASRTLLTACSIAALAPMLSGCVAVSDETPSVETQVPATVLSIGQGVADWQLANLDDFSYLPSRIEVSSDPTQWVMAAFYVGLDRFAEATDDDDYRAAVDAMSAAQDYELNERYWHGDDQSVAAVYTASALRAGDLGLIAPVLEKFDGILADPPTNSLEFVEPTAEGGQVEGNCQKRWCWADAIFMAPPAWLAVSNATGDPRYGEYAIDETLDVIDYLFDDDTHLMFRDSRYFDLRTENGKKVFWSRGNGWVFAGLARMIEQIDASDPRRETLVETYKMMADALVDRQRESGYWPTSLDDDALLPNPETSGTGFFGFGLAWGLNKGILTGERYETATEKAWEAMSAAVQPDGRLGWVQQIGKDPQKSQASDTQLYGAGAMLLFAAEMHTRSW